MERHRAERRTTVRPATADSGPGSGGLSAREVAALLDVHERTVRRAIRDGRLAATKNGRAFTITPEALDLYRAALDQAKPAVSPATRPTLTLLPPADTPAAVTA